MPSPSAFLVATLVMALGSACQAAVGIGLALLVVPVLAVVEPRFIPGPMLFAGIALAAGTAHRDRAGIDPPGLRLALVGLGIGTMLGAVALKLAGGLDLSKLFGALILLGVLLSLAGRVPASPGALLAGSMVSGIMGTMAGIHGPAISLALQHDDPARARAMLGAFSTVGYAIAVASLAAVGLFGLPDLALGLALLPGVAAGYALAPAFSRRVDRRVLRAAILVVSSLGAAGLLLR